MPRQQLQNRIIQACVTVILLAVPTAPAQQADAKVPHPWDNASFSPDERVDLVIQAMTLDEKLSMLHGQGMPFFQAGPTESNGSAGYMKAIPRLGIPSIRMADSAYGVTSGAAAGRYAMALPSNLAAASVWDAEMAYSYGALIGRELRTQGYNMSLWGGVNLAREPRNGRTFECQEEDPLLAGTLAGNLARGGGWLSTFLEAQALCGEWPGEWRNIPGGIGSTCAQNSTFDLCCWLLRSSSDHSGAGCRRCLN